MFKGSNKTTSNQLNPANQGIEGQASNRKNVMKRAKKSALQMAILVPLKFTICWTPHCIFILWDFIDSDSAKKLDNLVIQTILMIALLNSVLNPW